MPYMVQRISGKRFLVPDESVDFWRSVGYLDEAPPKPAPEKKPATRTRAAKK